MWHRCATFGGLKKRAAIRVTYSGSNRCWMTRLLIRTWSPFRCCCASCLVVYLGHENTRQAAHFIISYQVLGLSIAFLMLGASEYKHCTPTVACVRNDCNNVRRNCAGAVFARTDCSIAVQGSTYFDANNASDDGGEISSEEYCRSG